MRMPRQSEEIIFSPAGYDRDKMEDYRRRIERFEERQLAARARSIEARRRFRIFNAVVIGGLVLCLTLSAFVVWSLRRLQQTVSAQLQSAEAASNERGKELRRSLAGNEQMLARFRAETRASLLLPYVDTSLDRRFAPDAFINRGLISARLKEAVQPALVTQLIETPDAPDSQLIAQIEKLVDASLPIVLRRPRAAH